MSKNNILKRLSPLSIVAFVCAAVIIVTIIVSAVLFRMNAADKKKDEFDYTNNDLIKEYITLGDYSKLSVTHKDSEIRPIDVEEAVLNLLEGEKNKLSAEDASYNPTATITVGDVVNLYYRGYVEDADGNREYKDGMSNLVGKAYSAMSAHELSIGNSGFIAGFALALEGTEVGNYPEINRQRGDLAINKETDIIFVTYQRNPLIVNKYSGVETEGAVESGTSVLIDLALGKDKIDEIYGNGFYDMLFTGRVDDEETEDIDESINVAKADGKNIINNTKEGFKTTRVDNGEAYKYTTIKVEYKMSGNYYDGYTPIEVVFPEDYGATDLAGKTAKFQIMIESVEEYSYTLGEQGDVKDVVSLRNIEDETTRAAVNTVLKNALEDNKDFQKYLETQTDKEDYYANYKNYLIAKHAEDNALADKLALYDAIVDALVENATVLKNHPDFEEKYNASLISFRSSYASEGSKNYDTIEAYAEAVIGGEHYVYVYYHDENPDDDVAGEWKIFDGTAEEAENAGYTKIFDWKAAVRRLSVEYYTERLAIHQIVNEQKLYNEEAYDKAYNSIFDDYIAEYTKSYCSNKGIEVEDLTEKDKETIRAEVKNYVVSELGHEALEERAYYQLVYDYYLGENAKGELVRE